MDISLTETQIPAAQQSEASLAPKEREDKNQEQEVKEDPELQASEVLEESENVQPIEVSEQTTSGIATALRSDLKAQVEAVLFITDTPLKTGELSKMLNASYDNVQSALVQLIQEYEDRNGGLEIGTDDGYIIQVKTQYLNIVTNMMPLELNPGPMRTLSAIALKEPVLQSEIIDMRGSGAYDHVNELVEQELITKKPQGLSFTLQTTKKFKQYFRLTQEANKIKEKLQEVAIKRAKEKEAEKQEEEASKAMQEQPVQEQAPTSI